MNNDGFHLGRIKAELGYLLKRAVGKDMVMVDNGTGKGHKGGQAKRTEITSTTTGLA